MMGRYTLDEVRTHNRYDDAWTVLNGKVYNITSYLPFHQGGEKELMRCAGRDGTRLFSKSFRSFFLPACLFFIRESLLSQVQVQLTSCSLSPSLCLSLVAS